MRLRPILTSFAGLAAMAVLAACSAEAQQEAAPPPPQVAVTDVAFKNLRQWDDFTGRLEAIESVAINPRVGGYIDSIGFQEGARVRKGQVLFQIDPRPFQAEVNRLAAEVDRSRAQLELATANKERGRRLLDQNAVAQSEFERLEAEEKSARANVAAAQAGLQSARLNLEFTRVVSPIDGRVSKALITRGNLVTNGSLLTTVVSDTPIFAAFNADEQTFLKYASAERGKQSPVYLGLMTEEGYPHKGQLHFIDNAIDARSGTISGRAIFANADGRFTPGLFARIRMVSAASENVALVPDRAIATDLGKRYVMVVGADNKAQYRPVTLGPLAGGLRIVRQGLKPGDKVITAGLQKVRPGDTVKAVKAPAPDFAGDLAQLETTARQVAQIAPAGGQN
ncbi:efflux RND transporter periplasmic adaptor subunit [Caulobacter sp. NIBR2454]|uniref:efflux RND transporter periplasmic adaptor subunit n=1 Tax=Caulobacter sp. NIBR2454 TaxID=3015996 RepID=UPI0022B620B4|nr:efflux RND transporter periplasmic adaptor subunit [Caulobacter sp. NIBR2454]